MFRNLTLSTRVGGALSTLVTAYGAYYLCDRHDIIRKMKHEISDLKLGDNTKGKTFYTSKSPISAQYVLLGGGTATAAAMESILAEDPAADILVVSKERMPPYQKPPLSKEMWYSYKAELKNTDFVDFLGKIQQLEFRPVEFYSTSDIKKKSKKVRFLGNSQAVDLNVQSKIVTLRDGTNIQYDKLLLATGGSPKIPRNIQATANVTTLRTFEDFQKLYEWASEGKSIAVVGGGFLGSEISVALNEKAKLEGYEGKIIQIFEEKGILQSVIPEYIGQYIVDRIRSYGIRVKPSTALKVVEDHGSKVKITSEENENFFVDKAVLCLGIHPATKYIHSDQIDIHRNSLGVMTDDNLKACNDVFAAGDILNVDDGIYNRRIEHHNNAVISGMIAGENMVGKNVLFVPDTSFWSDIGSDISIEGLGIVDNNLNTIGVWSEHEGKKKGFICYEHEKVVVGILCLNLPNRLKAVREVLDGQRSVDDISEIAVKLKIQE